MVNWLTDRRTWCGGYCSFDSHVSFYTSKGVGLPIKLTRLCRGTSCRFGYTSVGRTNISASDTGSSSSSASNSSTRSDGSSFTRGDRGSSRLRGLGTSRSRLDTLVVQGILVAKDPFTNYILHLISVLGQTIKVTFSLSTWKRWTGTRRLTCQRPTWASTCPRQRA